MKIQDIVYGEFNINEPVLTEIIKSKAFNRLEGISQFGIPDKYYFKENFSRFEHSIGVMILLRKLGADIEEQIAGLIHDISQFSFSHISDWVFADGHKGNESYHDTLHDSFVIKTEIPKILSNHGFSVKRLLDEHNFPLLENNLPNICADRIDYSLRELAHNGDAKLVASVLRGIHSKNKKIYFNNKKPALFFSNAFLGLQTNHWASVKAVTSYSLFSRAFKIAVTKGLIVHDDFWNKSEDELIDILLASDNPEILSILTRLEKGQLEVKTGERVYKKFRYVDPFVMTENRLVCLSKIDPKYSKSVEDTKKINSEGILV